jgi:HAMP domain-containing protein
MPRTDAALTAAGLALGAVAAAAGLWLAHTQLIPRLRHNAAAAKAYDQAEAVATSISNLKGAKA